ncbi:MAG: xylulokinase [Chloroflexota bacterium]
MRRGAGDPHSDALPAAPQGDLTIQDRRETVLIGLDIGASGVDACAFSERGILVAAATMPLTTHHPYPGWAEQSPASWIEAALGALRLLKGKLGSSSPAAIGLTGQCPSGTLTDSTGTPRTSGLIFQDNRATDEARRIAVLLEPAAVRARTGSLPTHFQLAPKLLWLEAHDRVSRDAPLWLVQPRDLIGWRLTGEPATDPTHAGCTGLYDLHSGEWTHDWVEQLGLDWLRLPPILAPDTVLGGLTAQAAAETGFAVGIPVCLGAADNFCADLGMGAVLPGILGDTSGTSTCLDLSIVMPNSVAALSIYRHFLPELYFANTGLNATGAVLAWAAAALAGGDLASLEALAAAAPAVSDAPLLLPYLGEGDRFDAEARGIWHGLSLRHDPPRLARSVFEGLTFALRELLDGFDEAGQVIREVRLAGGGSRGNLWAGLKADIWGLPVRRAEVADATALGAALLAGTAIGLFRDLGAARDTAVRVGPPREPHPEAAAVYAELYARWRELRV